ncbi:MAG: hypothetical protein H6632_11315 [Anaerolineales bacterium]|nr:hypothetical protein [Anaerolineales bacterium]
MLKIIMATIALIISLSFGLINYPYSAKADSPTPVPSTSLEVGEAGTNTASPARPEPETYVKGVYMTYYAVGSDSYRRHIFNLLETTELNAVVIDIKGDFGLLSYQSDVITATAIGANDAPTITDWSALMQDFKARNIYTIARIVVFKDDYLAHAHPEWAVKTTGGQLWLDGENLPWLEAFQEGVWDYNIALAVEAAERGFDEIQFDYVRFPTDGNLSSINYSRDHVDAAVRTAAIAGFLAKAKAALTPYKVKLAADVFGYTTWNEGDFGIGQDLTQIAAHLDVLSPMVYPSTYGYGLPGLPQYNDLIVAHPYAVVYESMLRAMAKVKPANPYIILRPWIQDFPDYAFDRRTYTPTEIREQMLGAYDSGSGGWLLWDPRVEYTAEALVTTTSATYPPNEQGEIMILRYRDFGHTNSAAQRSLAGFRQDLGQLRAAGFYPVNLRDLALGQAKYQQDLAKLADEGWPTFQSDELLTQHLNGVPAGKRPVVLTFDGSHESQYRLLPNGDIDPNTAMGVLNEFHQQHPADWPLRATFFVQPETTQPAYKLFGQPELAEQKLQTIIEAGMEVGLYLPEMPEADYRATRRRLSGEVTLEALLPGYEIDSLAVENVDQAPAVSLLQMGAFNGRRYDYPLITIVTDAPTPSPRSAQFTRHRIPRINVAADTVTTWLDHYANTPDRYFVSAGTIPVTYPTH